MTTSCTLMSDFFFFINYITGFSFTVNADDYWIYSRIFFSVVTGEYFSRGLLYTFSINDEWSRGCQSCEYEMTSNGTVSMRLFMIGITSAPCCFAGQSIRASEPVMKSFWTSMMSKAARGWIVYMFLSFSLIFVIYNLFIKYNNFTGLTNLDHILQKSSLETVRFLN